MADSLKENFDKLKAQLWQLGVQTITVTEPEEDKYGIVKLIVPKNASDLVKHFTELIEQHGLEAVQSALLRARYEVRAKAYGNEFHSIDLRQTGMPKRLIHALRRSNCKTIGEGILAIEMVRSGELKIRNFSEKSCKAFEQYLSAYRDSILQEYYREHAQVALKESL